jgi:peptidoglycan/LPS O-acetylase OafA/YrhL
MFIVSPPQVYVERLTMDGFTGNFLQFIPYYFNGFYAFGGNFAWMGLHLWYLMVLFVFSLITLPLLLPGKKIGISLVSRLAVRLNNLGGLLLLFLPLAAAPFIANMVGLDITRQMGSWDILSYLIFFIIGFMISSSNGLQETIKRHAYHILVFAFIITLVGFLLDEMHYLIEMIGRSLISFSWVLGLIGTGSRLLNFKNRFSDYAMEAVLPFYILHQLVIVIVGYFVVQWNVGIGLKYVVVVSSSFIVIVAIYDLLVRRLPWLRFLFGMRRMKKGNGITT